MSVRRIAATVSVGLALMLASAGPALAAPLPHPQVSRAAIAN
jgi:hypothetical protein